MKRAIQSLPLALLASAVNAQTSIVVNNPLDTDVTTVFYSVCPTATSTTITLSSTLTYCPGDNCHGGPPPMITPAPDAGSMGPGGMGPGDGPLGTEIIDYTTVGPDGSTTHYQMFETVYDQPCLTCPGGGLVPATFTVTEECPCTASRPSTYLPSGFETTTYACDVCAHGGSPGTVTVTQPCATGPYANQATAAGGAVSGMPGSAPGSGTSGATPGAGTPGPDTTGLAAPGSGAPGSGATGSGSPGSGAAPGNNVPGGSGPAATGSMSTGASSGPATTSAPGAGMPAESASGAGKVVCDTCTEETSGSSPTNMPAGGAPGAGMSGSNSTVSPPITPVVPSTSAIISSYPGPNSASHIGMALSAVLAGVIGVLAVTL